VLREAIAAHDSRFWGLTYDPDTEVLVTAGATEALTATLLALLEPGDEVVVLEPFYDSYAAIIELAGARLVTVPLLPPTFQPDADDLRRAVTDRTRIILINSPHNPTGTIVETAFLEAVIDEAHRHDAWIVTDEVYEHLTFGTPHVPIGTLAGARERSIRISSGGKTFSATGWKIGWIEAPHDVLVAITAVKQFLTYVNGAPFQPAIAVGLGLPDSYFTGLAATLQAKRDILSAGLRAAGFTVSDPQGSYFVIADAAPLGFADGEDLARRLPELVGVVGVPLSAFVRPEHRDAYASSIRFAFCKREAVLEEAASRLAGLRVP
jgi:N-succinyldiaminopimelate aminotransferase